MKMSKIWRDTPEDIVKHILSFIIPTRSIRTRIILCIDSVINFFDRCNWIQVICVCMSLWFGYSVMFPPV